MPPMFYARQFTRLGQGALAAIALAVVLTAITVSSSPAADPVTYALCDVRVLYLTDRIETVDWPTLYYLNHEHGCRIDVAVIRPGERYRHIDRTVPHRHIRWHQFTLPPGDSGSADSLPASLLSERYPDIILIDAPPAEGPLRHVTERLKDLPHDPSRIFNVLKLFEREDAETAADRKAPRLVLNGTELLARYRVRMEREIPSLTPSFDPDELATEKLLVYRLVSDNTGSRADGADFLSGMDRLRLIPLLQMYLSSGPRKEALIHSAEDFVAYYDAAGQAFGREKVERIIEGYRELRNLADYRDFGDTLTSMVDFHPYLEDLAARAQHAALEAVGLIWEGKVVRRDSPHGPRLKFRVALSVNGPREIEITQVRFHPYWDTGAVVLDSADKIIGPHQSLVREYFIDVKRTHLESHRADTLLFAVDVAYGQVPLTLTSLMPAWEAPELDVRFEPDFYFVPPLPELDVDKVVSSMMLKAIVTKPYTFAGSVQLDLETPRGLFAGAYRQELDLEHGSVLETVRIPFSISRLFELGIQQLPVELSNEGEVVAADTAYVRIAACDIDDRIQIGILPDTAGRLEDILRMTDAAFQPLTDRALLTADLNAFDVIIVGSGAFRAYPSFRPVKDRFKEFVRLGGSLVVLPQPEDWPDGALPVALTTTIEIIGRSDITNRIPEARILSHPYTISDNNLLASLEAPREVSSAVVSPAERVYICPNGATLLSVSRLGSGQIIYCGLPLLEMISRLEIDAIHLLANILNY
ncbi:MAG: hypothetical protein AB1744_00625 [Candidatus Zixiibacteriota bacterium]